MMKRYRKGELSIEKEKSVIFVMLHDLVRVRQRPGP